MLYLRIANEACEIDVAAEFERIALEDRPVVRKILEKLEGGTPVSMNFWGFQRSFMDEA